MSSTMDRREHSRRGSLDRSGSPTRDHHSPRRRSSPRKERSPVHRKISPVSRSPRRITSSHRMRSPAREKIPDRDRSLKRTRPRSPLKNGSPGSPSPPTRRLRRTQAGREEEKVVDRDQRDKGRHKERGEGRDVPSERRFVGDGNDGGSSRSARRGRPVSPEERSPRRRYSSRSPPIENLLPGSLEDLYKGTTKRMKISREIKDANGRTTPVEEILMIDIKPGWKKGTKITFPGKGNEQPNVVPADIVFIIDEKPHPVFTRDGNDLVVTQKVPLAEALAGHTVRLTTLDGRSLTVPINSIIHPGYEEVLPREGMPIPKDPSKRGNLRIKFNVKFPTRLTEEQKAGIKRLLSP